MIPSGFSSSTLESPIPRRAFGAVLLLCALSACLPAQTTPARSPDGAPTLVFPQFSARQPLRLVVYGDSRFTDPARTQGTDPRIRRWLAERVGAERPQVLLLTGDTPYVGASAADWAVFRQESASWGKNGILTLPTTGNHEVYGKRVQGIENYLKNFPQIRGHRYYSALLGSVEVVSLDCTQPAGRTSAQLRWFAAQLDRLPAQVEFLLILYHMPWVADRQSQIVAGLPTKEGVALREALESRLPNLHARVAVFSGHIHNYERFERDGVEYVTTGGGGAEPYPILIRDRSDLYKGGGFPVYNYLTVEIGPHRLHAVMWKVKDPDAAQLEVENRDEFVLAAPSAPPPSHWPHSSTP